MGRACVWDLFGVFYGSPAYKTLMFVFVDALAIWGIDLRRSLSRPFGAPSPTVGEGRAWIVTISSSADLPGLSGISDR